MKKNVAEKDNFAIAKACGLFIGEESELKSMELSLKEM
jgi:hypothetical protein